MGINRTRYLNNQFEPQDFKSGRFILSANQTSNLTAGNQIEFDEAEKNDGISFDSVNNQWTLKAGYKHFLEAGIYGQFSAVSGYFDYQWYDVTNGAYLSTGYGESLTVRYGSDYGPQNLATVEITPSTDIVVELRIANSSSPTGILANYSYAKIIRFPKIQNPVTYPFLINAQPYELTVTGTGWTTTKAIGIPFKTIDGSWFLIIIIRGTQSSASSNTLSIAGVTFKNVTDYYQSLACHSYTSAITEVAQAMPNTDDIYIELNGSVANYGISGIVELEEKPDWL